MTDLGRGMVWPSYRDDPGALEPDMTDEQYERLTYQPKEPRMDEMEASYRRYQGAKRCFDDARRAIDRIVNDPTPLRHLNEEDVIRMRKVSEALREASDHIVAVWN